MTKIFQHGTSWFRVFGYGLSWTCAPLFSVRNGFKKSLRFGRWYVVFLRPKVRSHDIR